MGSWSSFKLHRNTGSNQSLVSSCDWEIIPFFSTLQTRRDISICADCCRSTRSIQKMKLLLLVNNVSRLKGQFLLSTTRGFWQSVQMQLSKKSSLIGFIRRWLDV